MSPAQTVALRRVAAAGHPVKVPTATAAVLSERYGFIVAVGELWEMTDEGRAWLVGDEYWRRHEAAEAQLTSEAKAWAQRVMAWVEAHNRLCFPRRYGRDYASDHTAHRYAEHYAACVLAGVEPVPPPGDVEWIEGEIDAAVRCLRDFDACCERAAARGVGVEVDYQVQPSHPRAKADAASPQPDGTVSLRAYKLAREITSREPA